MGTLTVSRQAALARRASKNDEPGRAPGTEAVVTASLSRVAARAGETHPGYRSLSELRGLIGLLPVPALLLAHDGTALEANENWAVLSGVPIRDALGEGWLQAIDALDRIALRALVQDAAVDGIDGSADVRIAAPGTEQWSRWSWGPVPERGLIVTVLPLADDSPPHRHPPAADDLVHLVAHRLFGVGLLLQASAAVTDVPGRSGLQQAVDELDSVIRDVRSRLFPARTATSS